MKKFLIRLSVCWKILFRRYDHWAILNVDKENLVLLFKQEEFEVEIAYHGVREYVIYRMIQAAAASKDEIDMDLDRILFEVEAEGYTKRKNP